MKNSVTSLAQRLNNKLQSSWEQVQAALVSRNSDEERQHLVNVFDAGRDVDFGALVLSQEGICTADDIIPWSALRSVRYENRELVLVRQCGNVFSSLRFSAGKLKHLPILLHLLQQHSEQPIAVLSR
jgi:hypothetical protein